MSSCAIVHCTQGFVISTDGIAFKQPQADAGQMFGRVKATTRKLFQLSDDVVAAAVGDFTSYLPVLNAAARLRLPTAKLVTELLEQCVGKAADSRIAIVSRDQGKITLDLCDLGHVRRDQAGVVNYPNPLLNGLFLRVFESPEGKSIRATGMIGLAGLVGGFNALAATLSAEMAPPFDTICFLAGGIFVVSGGITRLPIGEIW